MSGVPCLIHFWSSNEPFELSNGWLLPLKCKRYSTVKTKVQLIDGPLPREDMGWLYLKPTEKEYICAYISYMMIENNMVAKTKKGTKKWIYHRFQISMIISFVGSFCLGHPVKS